MKTVQYLKLDERMYTAVTCLTCIYYSHGQAQAEQGWLIEK
jgi:predicted nucleic-acid-binding Zn-ribbon protein